MQAQRPGDILVIESQAASAAFMQPELAARGHNVTLVRSSAHALENLDRYTFDVVLCAQTLSDGYGLQICDAIKSSPDLAHTAFGLLVDQASDIDNLDYRPSGLRATEQRELRPPDDYIVRGISGDELNARVQTLMRIGRYQQEISNSIGTLAKIAEGVEEQDVRIGGHCKRLSIMAVELGRVLGCDEWQLITLERAGYLHDIGKVSIPGALMDKIERLSPREMEIIQGHCIAGERLCMNIVALKPVLPIIRHHHERADGTGYPDRLRGEQIPILAQIFSIPDIYESLRVWRPYRLAMKEAQAIDVLRQEVARGYWNRLVFDAFVEEVIPGLNERLDSAHVLWPQI